MNPVYRTGLAGVSKCACQCHYVIVTSLGIGLLNLKLFARNVVQDSTVTDLFQF